MNDASTKQVKPRRRRFRIKGKKMAKSFKGLITGKSRKERRKKKALAAMEPIGENHPLDTPHTNINIDGNGGNILSPKSDAGADDESTVYDANFSAGMTSTTMKVESSDADETSVMSEPIIDPVQVVLLIMDPISRGFELLLLEFDSTKSTVKDILEQIPLTATEESLRTQAFDVVFDTEGKEMKLESLISDYIENAGVVIAVPKGNFESGEQVAKMALPILSDKDVSQTLAESGIDVPKAVPLTPGSSIGEEESPKETTEKPAEEVEKVPETKETTSPPSVMPETTTTPPTDTTTETTDREFMSIFSNILSGAAMAMFSLVLLQTHQHYKAPLHPGDLLSPGSWRSPCGLLKSIPSSLYTCDRSTLRMETNGHLSLYNDENEAVFSLYGEDVCDGTKSKCFGATVDSDGILEVAGAAPITLVGSIPTNGWPFGHDVTLPTSFKKKGGRR